MYEILAIALKKKEKLIWHKDKEQVLHAIEIKKVYACRLFFNVDSKK